jgi:FtsP/CotA-like multicopper oxidase with cupredoxin domain
MAGEGNMIVNREIRKLRRSGHVLSIILLVSSTGCVDKPVGEATQAIGLPSPNELPLDPTTVPKFAQPLPIPEVWTPTPVCGFAGNVIRNEYTLSVTQTQVQMLPPGYPATNVFAYSGMAAPRGSPSSSTLTVTPGAVFENTVGIPTRIHWQDNITQPAFLQVDPTIHWANPNYMNKPVPPFSLFPPGYPLALFPVAHVTHTHGLAVAPTMDGTAEEWFTNHQAVVGPSFVTADYDMPNEQAPTQLFYHDHVMGVTRIGLYSGVVGTGYFIRDPDNNPLDAADSPLPQGEFEIPLALTTRQFYTDGNLDFPPDRGQLETGNDSPPDQPYWTYNEQADEVLVNGAVWPNLNVKRQEYRFRVLAASNTQLFDLQLCIGTIADSADGRTAACTGTLVPITIIGSDGGYLPAPQTVNDVQIGITERADFLVDFSPFAAGTQITLMNAVGIGGRPPGTLDTVMRFTVQDCKSIAPPPLDPALFPPRPVLQPNAPTRIKVLQAFDDDDPNANTFNKRTIDGVGFSTPPTEYALIGSTEEWDLVNAHDPILDDPDNNTHQIHIHLLEFQVLNRQPIDPNAYRQKWALINGHEPVSRAIVVDPTPYFIGPPIPPKPYETGWKDTVQTPGGFVTRIIVRWAPQSVPSDGVDPGENLFPFDPTVFPDPFSGPGYVWHCHLVGHEDHDMMRPLAIVNRWTPGMTLQTGNVVEFYGVDYRVRQSHTTQPDWAPSVVPALFERVNNNDGNWAPQITYAVGDRVLYQGELYQTIQQHRAQIGWEPSIKPALWRPLPNTACAQLAQFCQGQTSVQGAACLHDGQAGVDSVCQGELSVCLSDCETIKATPCSGLCPNPVVFTRPDGGTYTSGTLGGGASCFETTSRIGSGTSSSFARGRQLTVNGRAEPRNGGWRVPLPPMRNDGYCIQVTANGNNSQASFTVQ